MERFKLIYKIFLILKKLISKNLGIAIPISITVILFVAIIFAGIWSLIQGLSTQRFYVDSQIKVIAIIESAYNIILARLMNTPWEDRWFKNKPDAKSNIYLDDGKYDYFIQDTPNKDKMVDLWIKGEFRNVKRVHFYRIRYHNPILKEISIPSPNFVASFDENESKKRLSDSNIQELSQKLDLLINVRNINRPNLYKHWFDIINLINPVDILLKLGAHVENEFILPRAIANSNVDTSVLPAQLKNSLNATSFIAKMESDERLLDWFSKFNKIDINTARYRFLPIISQINNSLNKLFESSKYLIGQVLYKEFLEFIFGISVFAKSTADTQIKLDLGVNFYKDLAEVAMKSNSENEFKNEIKKIALQYAEKAKNLEISINTIISDITSSLSSEANEGAVSDVSTISGN